MRGTLVIANRFMLHGTHENHTTWEARDFLAVSLHIKTDASAMYHVHDDPSVLVDSPIEVAVVCLPISSVPSLAIRSWRISQ
jgi:hypothetical protein